MTNPYSVLRSQVEAMGLKKPDAYNPYAAGPKIYEGYSASPNGGPTSDKAGYMKRDALARARKNAMMQKLKVLSEGTYQPYSGTGV